MFQVYVSLLALLAVNEPRVSAVTEWKVSDAKTATMLKWKHMLLYAFPANMHFIIFFLMCMCGKASRSRRNARNKYLLKYFSVYMLITLLARRTLYLNPSYIFLFTFLLFYFLQTLYLKKKKRFKPYIFKIFHWLKQK